MRKLQACPRTHVISLAGVALLVLFLAVGCGSPEVVSVRNVGNATAGPSETAISTALVAPAVSPTAVATQTGVAGMEGMGGSPTAVVTSGTALGAQQTAVATSAGGQGATPTQFVLIWVLFGTPTPGGPQPGTAAPAPTSAVAAATAAPTSQAAGLPVTATMVMNAGVTTAAPSAGTAAAGGGAAGPGVPARGKIIFTGPGTCFTCHDTSAGITIVGPSLKGIASRAGSRKPGMSAEDYLHESIVNPNAFVVQGFLPNIMPQTFVKALTPQQINDLVAYLMTLK